MEKEIKDTDHDKTNPLHAETIGVKRKYKNKEGTVKNYGAVTIRQDLTGVYLGNKVYQTNLENKDVSAGLFMFKSGVDIPLTDSTVITVSIKDPKTGLDERFKLKKENFFTSGLSIDKA